MLSSTSSPSAKIWVGLLTVLLLLSLNTAVSLLGSYRLTLLRDRVEHIHTELLSIERLYSAAVDAETGQRGYLLTGDERYLEPYQQALQEIQTRKGVLRQFASSGDLPSTAVDFVANLTDQKLAEMDQTIQARRERGTESATNIVREG